MGQCFSPLQLCSLALCLHLHASDVYLEAVACVNQRPVHSPVELCPFLTELQRRNSPSVPENQQNRTKGRGRDTTT